MDLKNNDLNIKTIDLSRSDLGDTEAIILSNFMMINTAMTSLDTRYNPDIELVGNEFLANAIVKNSIIKKFSGINIQRLKENDTNPTNINLIKTGCGDTELFVLGYLLYENSTLRSLDLRKNNICDVGAKCLVRH
eukprot:TRINITY_DN2348_c0_g1_i1.p1 TRINITY_DN2348_c0_g1~~TRINITY_DN2348_c0_g1_i1.p1  ORF type:complete len:135 (-),score=8.72 TRINITY_DN2348_c0_g1_i1:13-417(-)